MSRGTEFDSHSIVRVSNLLHYFTDRKPTGHNLRPREHCYAFSFHNILLQRLSSWFGVSGTALLWFQSYLSTRSFSVKPCSHSSQPLPLSCGVPQGSVLGPLLFILYTTPLSHLIKSSSVDHHLYA